MLLRVFAQVEDRGISLRFPRFLRVRDDKSADDATGPDQVIHFRIDLHYLLIISQIAELYERQALAQTKGKKKGGDADDGFW